MWNGGGGGGRLLSEFTPIFLDAPLFFFLFFSVDRHRPLSAPRFWRLLSFFWMAPIRRDDWTICSTRSRPVIVVILAFSLSLSLSLFRTQFYQSLLLLLLLLPLHLQLETWTPYQFARVQGAERKEGRTERKKKREKERRKRKKREVQMDTKMAAVQPTSQWPRWRQFLPVVCADWLDNTLTLGDGSLSADSEPSPAATSPYLHHQHLLPLLFDVSFFFVAWWGCWMGGVLSASSEFSVLFLSRVGEQRVA